MARYTGALRVIGVVAVVVVLVVWLSSGSTSTSTSTSTSSTTSSTTSRSRSRSPLRMQKPALLGKTGLPPLLELQKIQQSFWRNGALRVDLPLVADYYISQLPPATNTDSCLIAAIHHPFLPDFSSLLIESLAKNRNVSLHLYIHTNNTHPAYANWPTFPLPDSIKLFDLSSIDPSYRYRGFPGLFADRLCAYFKSPASDCELLEQRFAAYQGVGDPLTTQLRGLYPILFPHSVSRCTKWGFISPSVILGNLEKWIPPTLNFDVLTLSAGDLGRIYLRKDFALFKSSLKDLHLNCPVFASMQSLLLNFQNPNEFQSLVEGCFSAGVLQTPNLVVKVLPWMVTSEPDAFQIHNNRLTYCMGQGGSEICRGQLKVKTAGNHGKLSVDVFNATITKGLVSSTVMKTVKEVECCPWLPKDQYICVQEIELDNSMYTYTQTINTGRSWDDVKITLDKYEKPQNWVNLGMQKGVGEAMAVKLPKDWIKENEKLRVLKDWEGKEFKVNELGMKSERTWWYDTKKGSVLVTKTKIMFHTMQGVW